MESLNVKNINDEKIFNVIDPNGQGEVVNRIRPISISINQKAETINDQTDSTINLAVYWNDTWKSILDLTFDESLRQEYGKLTQDLTNIQKDIDMKQYKDAETKTNDFLKYVANLSSKYTAIPEKAVVSKTKNDFVKVIADKNSVKATISDKLLNFMLKKYAKVDTLDYTKANECFSTNKFNFLANNYDFYYHSPEIFQKQAYMTVVKDNKVVGSYKVNYDQFSKFASKFMLTPQKLGYSKDRLAGYMKTAEVVMQNIFFDSVDEAKEWQEMVDEKKKEQATTPEGEEEATETTTTETKTEMGEGKSESPVKEDGGLARPSEDFASDEIPESEPRQQEQQGGGQNLGASRRVNLLKKKASYTDKEISNIGYEQGAKDGAKAKGIKETQEIIDKNLNQLKEKYGKDKNGMGSFILKEWNSFVAGYTNGFSDGLIGNVEKKAKVGWNAKPENELEEIAVKIGDEIMEEGGFVFGQIQDINEEIRLNPAIKEQKGKELAELEEKHKKVVEDIVRKYRKEFANEEIAKLVDEHLEDNNFHTESSIVSEFVDNEILASKKVKLNKKAGIDMNLSYGHFLKEEDENKLPKFNTLEDIKTYIKTNNKFPGNFFYKGGLFTEDEYDMDGMVVTYGSPEIDKSIIINTPDNRYNYKGNYKNLDMDIVEEDAPYFRTDVNYTLPKKVYEELFPKKNSNKNLKLNKKADYNVGGPKQEFYATIDLPQNGIKIENYAITNDKGKIKISFAFNNADFKFYMLNDSIDMQLSGNIVATIISNDFKFGDNDIEENDLLIWLNTEIPYLEVHGIVEDTPKGIQLKDVYCGALQNADFISAHLEDVIIDDIKIDNNIEDIYYKQYTTIKNSNKNLKLNKKALYGDVQEQDIVPAKTETKVYLQSEDKAEEQTVEEKIEEAETSDIVKGKIGVGDIVTVCIDKLEYPEESFKYTELIGQPLILMENDKEDINKVIVEQTEYPFQRMTVNKDDIIQYAELKGADVVVEDVDGDEMITTFEELPVVAKQCKIKSIHKAATKKKANLTKKAINSLEDVAGLIDTIVSDYDWYGYFDSTEVGELSLYDQFLADVQKDEKGTIEKVLKYIAEDDDGYTAPEVEQLKEYYNAKFGGK